MTWFLTKDSFLRRSPLATKREIDLYDVDTDHMWSLIKNNQISKKGFDAWFEIHSSVEKPIRLLDITKLKSVDHYD